MPQIDHGVLHQIHTVMALLFDLKAQQQPFEFILGTGTTASRNCTAVEYRSSEQRSPGSPTGFPRMSGHPAVQEALRNHYFDSLVLPDSMSQHRLNPVEPPWYATRIFGGVGGAAPCGAPDQCHLAKGRALYHDPSSAKVRNVSS
jgi:hypothetical protein